jgi:hypothetical protein
MAHTFKTDSSRLAHKLHKAGNRKLREAGLTAAKPLFDAAAKLQRGLRYGNQRKAVAALKVKLRRLDRRQTNRTTIRESNAAT